MSFLNPEYFWLFLFILAALLKRDLGKINIRILGYLITFALLVIALARPVIEQEPIKSKELLNDVVLAVDLSYSMHSDDIKPSRLGYVKQQLKTLVQKEQQSRFGILGFTTNAIILSPLTQDSELLLHLFESLDENMILTKGSSIMPALKLSRKLSMAKKVSVVLFSDGGDQRDFSSEIAYAKENGLIVNLFMSGTSFGGTLKTKSGELLKDEQGDIVVSRENRNIKSLSDATGGIYTKKLSELRSSLHSQRDQSFLQENMIVQNKELYYYFVGLAILVFLVSVTTLKRFFIPLVLLFGVQIEAGILDFAKNENSLAFYEGVGYYKEGKYEEALEAFSRVRSPEPKIKAIVFYNQANALIRLKKFSKAREALLKSLTLQYTKEADENLQHIKNIPDNYEMSTGMQKSKKEKQTASKRESSQKQKNGGGSNMQVDTSSSGSGEDGKEIRSAQSKIDLKSSKAKLSSKQYELINKRVVNEEKPW